MRLVPISDLGDTPRGSAAAAILLQESPLLRDIDAQGGFELDATAHTWRPENSTATVQTRPVGGNYTATAETPEAEQTGALKFYGDALTIDVSHQADNDRGLRDLTTWEDKMLSAKFRSWARGLEPAIFNHDGSGNTMKGMTALYNGATNLPGHDVTGVVNAADYVAGADHFDLSNKDNYPLFLEVMTQLFYDVNNARSIYTSRMGAARLDTIAQALRVKGETRDQYGRPVMTFNGVPIIPLLPGTISDTEPDDADAEVTTSIWVGGWAEMQQAVVTNSGLYFREVPKLEGSSNARIEWEIRMALKAQDKYQFRRLRNVRL